MEMQCCAMEMCCAMGGKEVDETALLWLLALLLHQTILIITA